MLETVWAVHFYVLVWLPLTLYESACEAARVFAHAHRQYWDAL
jgi:hypothetical protein